MKTTDEQKEIWTKVYVRLTAAERRVADDISARSHESASHELRWAEELLSLVELLTTLDTPVPWMASSLFWVRVHGVVREFIQYNRQQADWARTLTEAERSQSLARFSQAIFEASQAMLASLTEEEVVVADYLRQRNAHLRLSAYALSLNKNVMCEAIGQ
jgi:hypothetical protein